MIEKIVLLAAITLSQSSSQGADIAKQPRILYEPFAGCPPIHVHYLLPHEYDCTKFYYCEYGLKWIEPRDCAPGTEFSAKLQVCVQPFMSNCTLPGYSTTESPTTTPASTTTPTPTTTQGPSSTEVSSTSPPDSGLLPNGCPANSSVHQLLPHESDCEKFYYCVSGEKVERSCAPGTYFNSELQVCDWPENVDCTSTNIPQPEGNGPLANGCPSDSGVHQLLPHESDCDKFYYCVSGEKVERSCAPGTHFNAQLQVCDSPENVECGNSNNNPEPEDNGSLPNRCPSVFDEHQLLPHESDCDRFYYCVFGEKVERSCAPGTLFNPELQACDWPQNVNCAHDDENIGNCNDGSNCIDNGTDNDSKCRHSCNVPAWAHATDCDKYHICEGEKAVLVTCSEGLHFNANTKTCDVICNAGCVRQSVQTTASAEGIKVFVPWDKVDTSLGKILGDTIKN